MAFTLLAPPGFVDLADAELAAEKIAQGQHLQKIIENYKFGTVRPEFFYMGRFVDGDVVGLPQSKVDRLPYAASEVMYLWMPAITTNPKTGITGGPGTVLWFDWQVEQFGENQPGLVHTKTIYHVQGGQTTETTDGKLSVWAVAVRGKGILSMSAVPAWFNFPDTGFDLDSVWKQSRAQDLNKNAKRDVVQAEFFDMGEFGNGQTVPQPVSDVDGFTYSYADVLFLPCWRWTPAFSSGQTTGPAGHTIYRMEASVAAGTGVVTTAIGYRSGASSTTATTDGRVRVFAFCFRGGLTITGTTAFADVNGANLASGKKMNDKNMVEVNQSIKFAALRPEYFLTTQAHGSTVPLPTSPVDGYTYARSELVYMAIRQDTSNPGSIGSLLTLHGFVRQDTGVVTLNTFYFVQGGSQTNTNNGTLRVITIGLRSDDVVTDSDSGGATGGGTGSDGSIDNTIVSGGGIVLMRNPDFESGDKNWALGGGHSIVKQPADTYDGDWVALHTGTGNDVMDNDVFIPVAPGDRIFAACMIKKPTGAVGGGKVRLQWKNIGKANLSSSSGPIVSTTGYTQSRIVATAPASAAFVVVQGATDSAPDGDVFFDAFRPALFPLDAADILRTGGGANLQDILQRLSDLGKLGDMDDILADGATYGRLRQNNLTSGNLNLALSAILGRTLANIADAGARFAAVEAGANKNAAHTLGMKINATASGASNPGEVALHGFSDGDGDFTVDGFISWNGAKITIPRDAGDGFTILGGGIGSRKAFILFDTAKPGTPRFAVGILRHTAIVYKDGAQWKYDNNSAPVNFTPIKNRDVALGWVEVASDNVLDGGMFGSPIGIELAAFPAADITGDNTAALIAGQGALATKSAVDLATGEVLNKTAGNIAETGSRKWLPDLARIFTSSGKKTNMEALEASGFHSTKKYHESAGRLVSTTIQGNFTNNTSFTTVASFSIVIPTPASSYKGNLRVRTLQVATSYTVEGRLKIGSLFSSVVTCTGIQCDKTELVTVGGLTGGVLITIEVQCRKVGTGVNVRADFDQHQYVDQDEVHFS